MGCAGAVVGGFACDVGSLEILPGAADALVGPTIGDTGVTVCTGEQAATNNMTTDTTKMKGRIFIGNTL